MLDQLTCWAHIMILVTMPPVITYATVAVIEAVATRCRPWQVGTRGYGGAVILMGYALYNFSNDTMAAVSVSMAVILLGASLVTTPFVYGLAERLTNSTR